MQEGHEFFCEVDRGYIEDTFNLYGLRMEIPHFKSCLNIILDISDHTSLAAEAGLDQHVMDLYGKIHARYILTKRGMDRMLRKYRIGEFGVCPMMECVGQPVLPIGLRDQLKYHEVMVYCPRCNSKFYPAVKQLSYRDEHLDGAYFGTTFAHLLLMQYPALRPQRPRKIPKYEPRVFGFKVRMPPRPGDPPSALPDKPDGGDVVMRDVGNEALLKENAMLRKELEKYRLRERARQGGGGAAASAGSRNRNKGHDVSRETSLKSR